MPGYFKAYLPPHPLPLGDPEENIRLVIPGGEGGHPLAVTIDAGRLGEQVTAFFRSY